MSAFTQRGHAKSHFDKFYSSHVFSLAQIETYMGGQWREAGKLFDSRRDLGKEIGLLKCYLRRVGSLTSLGFNGF